MKIVFVLSIAVATIIIASAAIVISGLLDNVYGQGWTKQALSFSSVDCYKSSLSEDFVNFLDDDCDGKIDEDVTKNECGNGIIEGNEFCDDGNLENLDGCSWDCKVETKDTIYVAPYVGNIDGGYNEDWYKIFWRLTNFHNNNKIPVGFSFYAASLKGGAFGEVFLEMYKSDYIDLIQKAYAETEREAIMYTLSSKEVREIVKKGQDKFRDWMLSKGFSNPKLPIAYNQPQGGFTAKMRDVLEDLGFKIFFDMYKMDDLDRVEPTANFDVIQYGVAITADGSSGRNTFFLQPEKIIEEIKSFEREDVVVEYINGNKIVPVWCHQQDFESMSEDNQVNEEKWRIYTDLMNRLKNDPDIVIVNPSEIYNMKHNN